MKQILASLRIQMNFPECDFNSAEYGNKVDLYEPIVTQKLNMLDTGTQNRTCFQKY